MFKPALVAAVLLVTTAIPGPIQAAGQTAGIVYFTEWSALLDDAAKDVIKNAAGAVQNGNATVTGYADVTGGTEANDLLSATRAQVVIDQLVADGVPAGHLKRADKGATPAIGSGNESRRVLIRLDE